jgi:periplasmic protein TonB
MSTAPSRIAIQPGDHAALLERANAYWAKGDGDRAHKDYGQVVASLLRQVMLYPAEARTRRQEGKVKVTFRIDRDGRVTARSIVGSSGNPLLDLEALAMIQRAQPFPQPPHGAEDRVDFATDVRFALR